MADALARHAGTNHPTIENLSCLQRCFGGGWRTAENIARKLGFPITERPHGGVTWSYVPHEAIGEIMAAMQRWAEEAREARSTKDRVSCRILDLYLNFSTAHFARQLHLSVTRPSDGEEEYFIDKDDIPAVVDAARKSEPQGIGWRTAAGTEDAVLRWVEERRLIGLTHREAVLRKQKVDASKGPSRSSSSWPPF